MSYKILLGTFCGVLAVWSTNCFGQPLVNGDLSVYYSFDEVDEDGIYADGSGNGLHGQTTLGFEDANDDGLDDIRLVTDGAARGAGYVLFDTDADVREDYIAICDPVNQPDHNDGCGEFLDDRADYVPSTAFSIAAWLKVEDVGQDHSIYQSRAGGGGFTSTQLQSNGNARFHLRGDANGDNLVSFNEPVNDGDVIDYEEWIHFAGTWDSSVGDFGEAAIFYNGKEVARFEANGNVAGDPDFGVLGDWAQGAFVGLLPDFHRQLVGGIDEFYIFTRAITADEVGTLYALDPGPATELARTELDAANQQLTDFKANNPQPEPPIGEDRIWFAAKGDYTFHGRAVDIRDDIVTLRASEGGRTVDLPIARLDEKHHEEIAELFADYQQASSNWQKKCQMLEEAVERQKKTLEKLSLEEAERERQRVAVVEENANHADALNIDLQRPGDREFIRDLADLIDPEDEEQIRQLCDQLLTDKATPIIVITINSMANHGGAGMRIETFATLLFDQWGIGHAKLGDQEWNTGILLLVSKNDRKARIELGGGWGRRQDELCRQIMDEQIVFHFKQGQFSEGIVAGVNALDKMGRQLSLPTAPKPSWYYPAMIALLGLAVFTAVSLVRRGSSGWAWVFFGVVFAFLFMLLRLMAQSSGGGDGGSFGEGSSGGGGATGSW